MGKAGAGKDHVASECQSILEKLGIETDNLKFARMLKLVCSLVWGWDFHELDENPDYKEEVPEEFEQVGWTRRRVMQVLGTDVFRDRFGENVWVDAVLRWARRSPAQVHLATDARFQNEIEALRAEFGRVLVVKLHRKGEAQPTSGADHVSEDLDHLDADVEFHIQAGDHDALHRAALLVSSEASRWIKAIAPT